MVGSVYTWNRSASSRSTIASVFLLPLPVVGLALSLLVAVLAFVNLAFGYCLGCQIYYQLSKAGLIRA